MLSIIDFFKKTPFDNDVFGSAYSISILFLVLDFFIRVGVVKIALPTDFLSITVTSRFAHLMSFSICLSMIFHFLCIVIYAIEETDAEIDIKEKYNIWFVSFFSNICLAYSLYRLLVGCSIITVEAPIKMSFVESGLVKNIVYAISCLIIVCYYTLSIYSKVNRIFQQGLWDENQSFEERYNTYMFQFETIITKEQIDEINDILKQTFYNRKALHLSSDFWWDRYYKGMDSVKLNLYVDFSDNTLCLGVANERGMYDGRPDLYVFKTYVEAVDYCLIERGYAYHISASIERYTRIIRKNLRKEIGQKNIILVKKSRRD